MSTIESKIQLASSIFYFIQQTGKQRNNIKPVDVCWNLLFFGLPK